MKFIFLMRHGKAEDAPAGGNDYDRKLISKGKEKSRLVAKELKVFFPDIEKWISSSAPRAFETALEVAVNMGVPLKNIEKEKKLYESNPENYFEKIYELDNDYESVIFFGHNPTISEVAFFLCPEISFSLSKAACVGISFNTDEWSKILRGSGRLVFSVTH